MNIRMLIILRIYGMTNGRLGCMSNEKKHCRPDHKGKDVGDCSSGCVQAKVNYPRHDGVNSANSSQWPHQSDRPLWKVHHWAEDSRSNTTVDYAHIGLYSFICDKYAVFNQMIIISYVRVDYSLLEKATTVREVIWAERLLPQYTLIDGDHFKRESVGQRRSLLAKPI